MKVFGHGSPMRRARCSAPSRDISLRRCRWELKLLTRWSLAQSVSKGGRTGPTIGPFYDNEVGTSVLLNNTSQTSQTAALLKLFRVFFPPLRAIRALRSYGVSCGAELSADAHASC